MSRPVRFLNRLLDQALGPLRDRRPASRLIRQTARQEWRQISITQACNLLQAATEGATLGVIFLVVDLLSRSQGDGIAWSSKPVLSAFPAVTQWLDALPRTSLFLVLLSLAVLLKLTQSAAMFLGSVAIGYYANRTSARLTARLHSQVLAFTYACASRYRVGDLQYINGAGPGAVITEINLLSGLGMNVFMLITYLIVLISISPWLLLVALLMAGILALVQQQLLPRLRNRALHATELGRELGSMMTENIMGLRLLHSTGQLDEMDRRVERQSRLVEVNSRAQVRLNSLNGPIIVTLPILMIAMIAAMSMLFFGDRNSGVLPSLVTFVVALQRLNGSFGSITQTLMSLRSNSANIDLLNAFLIESDKQFRRRGGLPFQPVRQGIRLEHVGLRYAPELAPALVDINLEIPRGKTIALVGSSGAGKSSIADLLAGLYDPTQGRILLDGRDLAELDLPSWQQRLGVVSQDTFLFNATIAANIAFGTPGADQAAIEQAATLAQATGFIRNLPDGFNTLVGERGYRLSGGQRQRLSLARAILRNPDLLILDEATSALDTESERLVQQAIDQFENTFTVLVIAHRLSTIVNADLICVMDHGRIIEQGSHAELISRGGRYASLWNQQASASRQAIAAAASFET